ncbi:unnamed protein product [Linum trigynum]|uniref:Dynein light chain n=1 Tax=Linum trigynum TaxID=586398 RepID=A0AAV2CF35_9ROSI
MEELQPDTGGREEKKNSQKLGKSNSGAMVQVLPTTTKASEIACCPVHGESRGEAGDNRRRLKRPAEIRRHARDDVGARLLVYQSFLDANCHDKRPNPTRLAMCLKKEFDGAYGPAWHCISREEFPTEVRPLIKPKPPRLLKLTINE